MRNLSSEAKDDAVGICIGVWPKGKVSVGGLSKGYHWLEYRWLRKVEERKLARLEAKVSTFIYFYPGIMGSHQRYK